MGIRRRNILRKKGIVKQKVRSAQLENGGFENGFSLWDPQGPVFVSTLPHTGRQSALFNVPPRGFASLSRVVNLNNLTGTGNNIRLVFFLRRASFSMEGQVNVSFSNSLRPPRIIQMREISDTTFQRFSITIPRSNFRSAVNTLRFEAIASNREPNLIVRLDTVLLFRI